MGQSSSSSITLRDRGRRLSYHGSFPRSKLNKTLISGPSYFPKLIEENELMNINIATEEQLMTLPRINRQLAREIVRHRDIIGPFKQIGDLLLISGKNIDFPYVTHPFYAFILGYPAFLLSWVSMPIEYFLIWCFNVT